MSFSRTEKRASNAHGTTPAKTQAIHEQSIAMTLAMADNLMHEGRIVNGSIVEF